MIIYIIMFVSCVILAFMSQRYPIKTELSDGSVRVKPRPFFVVISAIPLVFFAGMRGNIADTGAYIRSFEEMNGSVIKDYLKNFSDNKDVGFKIFTFLIKCVTSSYTVWLFIIAILTATLIWLSFYKHSDSFTFSVFLFFGTTSFSWMFNGMRQYIAIAVLFAAFPLLLKTGDAKKDRNNIALFILIDLLISTVHLSALVILPVFLLCRGEMLGRWQTLAIAVFVGASSFVTPFINFIVDLFSDTQYQSIGTDIEMYGGASIFRLIIAAVPVFLGLIKHSALKRIEDPVFKFCFNMSVFNVCLWIPAVVISGNVFGRFTEYCNIFNLILYPMLVERLYVGTFKKLLKIVICFVFVFWFYYQMKLTWNWGYDSPILGFFA